MFRFIQSRFDDMRPVKLQILKLQREKVDKCTEVSPHRKEYQQIGTTIDQWNLLLKFSPIGENLRFPFRNVYTGKTEITGEVLKKLPNFQLNKKGRDTLYKLDQFVEKVVMVICIILFSWNVLPLIFIIAMACNFCGYCRKKLALRDKMVALVMPHRKELKKASNGNGTPTTRN